jgi:invasion protein IalB
MTDKKNKLEKKMIKTMKKGSRIMVKGHTQNGSQTIDHYSLLGFTKAYNATKANCS